MSLLVIIGIIVVIVFLGFLDIILNLKTMHDKGILLQKYYDTLEAIRRKVANKQDITEEATIIFKISPDMYSIMDYMPIIDISSDLRNHKITSVIWRINRIDADIIEGSEKLRKCHSILIKQLYNPFTLFYRGIGRIMYIVFGYLIKTIAPKFNFEGKTWIFTTTIISLISGGITIWQFIDSIQ